MSQKSENPQETGSGSDAFYTPQSIQESFDTVEEEISKWRLDAQDKKEPEGVVSRIRRLLGGKAPVERFVEKEKSPPRLIRLSDSTGPVYFEFTEVEGGGTVVKATYDQSLKSRIARLKAGLPLKIPATPIGLNCPSCGKPVLKEFNLCPYCGSELIKE